jgi:parallel beta-helix repeat protein
MASGISPEETGAAPDQGGPSDDGFNSEWVASPATFLDILAEAPSGATIELGAGTYRIPGTIEIRSHVFLSGAGPTRTRLDASGAGPALRVVGNAALALRDLTVAASDEFASNAIEAVDGALILERVRVTRAHGRRQRPGASEPEVPEPGYGVVLDGDVWATITSCQFDGNDSGGICIRGSCAPTLVDIQVEGGTVGVVYAGHSSGSLTRSRCLGAAIGVLVLDRARPILEGNVCRANTHTGIAYRLTASGLARANDCSDNGSAGIWVGDAATPNLEGNQCRGNRTAGIAYRRAAGGSAIANACSGSAIAGIWISEGACPDLYANRCEGNANGLAYTEYSGGTASANVCGGNTLFGISVAALASPTIEDNVLDGNVLGTIVDQRSSDFGLLVVPN